MTIQLKNATVRRGFVGALALAVGMGLTAQAHEKVTFPSTDGDLTGGEATNITGYLYKPEGQGPFPAVISMHGCNGLVSQDGKIDPLYGAWGELLSREGYMVLLPDSFGSRGYGDLCAIQPPTARPVQPNRDIPRDNYGALSYLSSRTDVRSNAIAILGQSFGASSMFYTIAEGAESKVLPPGKDFRAAIAFYPTCQLFLERPQWRPRTPLLFLMGEADNFTPPAPCKQLLAAVAASGGQSVEAHWYPGAYHAFDHPNLPERVLTNIKLPPDGHSPTVASNHKARADAIEKVKAFLASKLR